MSHGIEPPTAGDYANAAAQNAYQEAVSARRKAEEAVELEQGNRELIGRLVRRQRLLEEHSGASAYIDMRIQQEEEQAEAERRVQQPPFRIGGAEIPPGWEPTVDGGNLVFRKKVDG